MSEDLTPRLVISSVHTVPPRFGWRCPACDASDVIRDVCLFWDSCAGITVAAVSSKPGPEQSSESRETRKEQ